MANIWALREFAGIGFAPEGYCISYDFSVDVKEWWNYNDFVLDRLQDEAECALLGHIGDGNVHFCVICKEENAEHVESLLEPEIFKWLRPHRGSISAEHGIGF